jgi:DNA-binding NarL/FixJ family response regulator
MISVTIVDDKRDIREGLRKILDKAEGFQCLTTYGTAESALSGIQKNVPDVVLMDIELPEMSGIECVKILKRKLPHLDIIMLTSHTEDEYIFQSLQAGAYGYLTKNIFPSRLLNAIREVRRGGAPMSSYIARRVVSSFNKFNTPFPNLSEREVEVLHLLCEGGNYREIARKLYVSPNTVRFHLKNIYKKLQVNSRHEAVMLATRVGIA